MTQSRPSAHAGAAITIQKIDPLNGGSVLVRSDGVDVDGRIGTIHAADGENLSPPIVWSRVLEAKSFALIVEDPDAPGDTPFVHWMIWDIPGAVTGLPAGVELGPRPANVPGAVQGRNGKSQYGWFGPRPPEGHGVHRYHFQLFALGKKLGMPPETSLQDLTNALKASTVACGELIGLFERKDPAADAESPARTGSYGVEPSNRRPAEREVQSGRGGLDADDADRHAPHDPDGVVRPRGEGGRA